MVNSATERAVLGDDQYLLVDNLSQVPHKILKNYNLGFLSNMVLHELGHQACFGFKRAAYLVDNPDFDHLVGMAGFCKCDCKHHKDDIWACPNSFESDMNGAEFHNEVKKIAMNCSSFDVKMLGKMAGMKNPEFFKWNMKHGNYGILVFEQDIALSPWKRSLLANAAALLSLCGI